MNISTKQSNKIKILSFCSIIFVVWMHAYYLESERWPIIYFAQKFVALFADFAVPLFFIISGFLFFTNFNKVGGTANFFISKIKKRMRTLILPYVIWCTLFIAEIFIIGSFIDLNTDYFAYCRQGSWWNFLLYVYFKPAAFHLWVFAYICTSHWTTATGYVPICSNGVMGTLLVHDRSDVFYKPKRNFLFYKA